MEKSCQYPRGISTTAEPKQENPITGLPVIHQVRVSLFDIPHQARAECQAPPSIQLLPNSAEDTWFRKSSDP